MKDNPIWFQNDMGMEELANPPTGLRIVKRIKSSTADIATTLQDLASILPPEQAEILRASAERLRREANSSS